MGLIRTYRFHVCISVTRDFHISLCARHPKSKVLTDERRNAGASVLLNTAQRGKACTAHTQKHMDEVPEWNEQAKFKRLHPG